MGTDTLFWTQFRALYEEMMPEQISTNGFYGVDASTLLYSISRGGLGADLFRVDPCDEREFDALANKWTSKLLEHLKVIADVVPANQITMFFEDKTNKARHARKIKGRAGKITKALKTWLEPTATYFGESREAQAMKAISSVYGRPHWKMTLKIAEKIQQLGFNVSACDKTDSDPRICSWARSIASEKAADITVISTDSDYLVFSPPESVVYMAFPTKDGKLRRISKAAVLKEAGLTPLQLVIAFCLAGSDNITTKIPQIGWYRAVKYVKRYIKSSWTADRWAKKPSLPRLANWKNSSPSLVKSLMTEICAKLGEFHWFGGNYNHQTHLDSNIDSLTEPELISFAFATDPKTGMLIRRKVARLVLQHFRGSLTDERTSTIEHLLQISMPASVIKKRKLPFENSLPNESISGSYKTRSSGKIVSVPGVKEIAIADIGDGPKFFPQWFANAGISDLVGIQKKKGTCNCLTGVKMIQLNC